MSSEGGADSEFDATSSLPNKSRFGVVKAVAICAVIVLILQILSLFSPYWYESDPVPTSGYTIELIAEDIGTPTCLVWADNYHVLICDREDGRIIAIEYDIGAQHNNELRRWTWLDGFVEPHGLHIASDYIIVSEKGKLTRINHSGEDTLWLNSIHNFAPWTLIEGVPTGNHQPNAVHALPNGTLVWHVGSTCNVCNENDPRNAALLWVNPESGEHGVLASGVRNSYDGIWVPDVGYVFTDNGRDWDGDDYPLEELNLLTPSSDYGWPNDGPATPVPDGTLPPIATFTAHSSANGVALRTNNSSLIGTNHSIFVTVFGSWNRQIPSGGEIIRVDLVQDENSEQGWSGETTIVASDIFGVLPIASHPDGDVFFANYMHGTLYRLSAN